MRRPLLYAALAAALTLLAAIRLPLPAALVWVLLAAAGFGACCILRKRETARVLLPAFLAAAAAGAYFFLITAVQVQPVQAFGEREALVSGVIQEEPVTEDGRTVYILKADACDLEGFPLGAKLRITDSTAQRAEAFDRYTARVRLYAPKGWSAAGYYADGIYLCGAAAGEQAVERAESRPPYYLAIRARQYVRSFFETRLSYDEAAALNGLLLGDKTGMTAEQNAAFRDSGISHIMAVSGMHLAVICQALLALLRKLRVGRRPSAVIAMAAVLVIMAVTGFSASILRAGVTYLIMLAGSLFFARADGLNSLGGAVLAILALNPFNIMDLSFQLSVCATLGILAACPPLYRRLEEKLPAGLPGRILRPAAFILAQSAVCTLFTLPVILLRLDQVSLVAPLTNLAVSFAATAALLCGLLAVLLSLWPPLLSLGYPLLLAAGLLIRYIGRAAAFFAGLPFATAPTAYGYLQIFIAGAFLLMGLAVLLPGRRRMYRLTAILTAFLFLVGSGSYAAFSQGITKVTLLDTDTGLAVLLTRGGRYALIGAGGEADAYYAVRDAVRGYGVGCLDLVALPSLDAAYTGGLPQLLRDGAADMLAAPGGRDYAASLSLTEEQITAADWGEGGRVELWGDVAIRPVACGGQAGAYLQVGGTAFLLLPTPASLSELPAEYQKYEALLTTAGRMAGVPASPAAAGLVSGESGMAERGAAYLTADGLPSYATGGGGSLTVRTRGRGDITVRREGE